MQHDPDFGLYRALPLATVAAASLLVAGCLSDRKSVV